MDASKHIHNSAHPHHSHHPHTDLDLNFGEIGSKVFQYTPPINTFLAITLITLTTQALISVCPQPSGVLLTFLVSFAAGGMLGNIFLHMMTEIECTHQTGLVIITGFLTFILIDKVIKVLGGSGHDHSHSHGHNHSHADSHADSHSHDHTDSSSKPTENEKDTESLGMGWVNVIADTLHNVTDGFALALAFHKSAEVGFVAFCLMCLHEIPHQFGDFAILIKSGVGKSAAIKAQLITSVGTSIGASIGCASTSMDTIAQSLDLWATPFTVGVFLYVVCMNILPELLETDEHASVITKFRDTIVMFVGITCGLLMLQWVS